MLKLYPTVPAFLATMDQLAEEKEAQLALLKSLFGDEDIQHPLFEIDLPQVICDVYSL